MDLPNAEGIASIDSEELTNNPPAEPGGLEREPLKAAWLSAAHERRVGAT